MRTNLRFPLGLAAATFFGTFSLTACVVGDTNNLPQPATDAGPTGDSGDPDAPPQPVPAFTEITGDLPGIEGGLHVVSATEMYAIANDAVSRWDGTQWSQITETQLGLADVLHFVGPDAIYAAVGNRIDKWTGILGQEGAWAPMTQQDPVLVSAEGEADIQYISDELMYGVITPNGELPRIRKCEGTPPCTWGPMTDPIEGLGAFHYVSDTEIYAITGEKISLWNGLVWADHTPLEPGLKDGFHYVAPNEIYAAVGDKIRMYNGTAFEDVTDEIANLLPSFHFATVENIHVIAGQSVHQWAPVIPSN